MSSCRRLIRPRVPESCSTPSFTDLSASLMFLCVSSSFRSFPIVPCPVSILPVMEFRLSAVVLSFAVTSSMFETVDFTPARFSSSIRSTRATVSSNWAESARRFASMASTLPRFASARSRRDSARRPRLSTIRFSLSSPFGPPKEPAIALETSLRSFPMSAASFVMSSNPVPEDPSRRAPFGRRGAAGSPALSSTYLSPSMPRDLTCAIAPWWSSTLGSRARWANAVPSGRREMPSTLPTRTPAIRTADLSSRPATSLKCASAEFVRAFLPKWMSSIFRMRTPRATRTTTKNAPIFAVVVMARPSYVRRPGLFRAPLRLGLRRRELAVAGHECRDTLVLRLLELLRGHVDVDLASREKPHTVRYRERDLEIVRDRDRRRFEPRPHLLDDLHDDVRRDRVEAGRGFVEKEDFGLQRDRAREAYAAPHPSRKLGRALVLDAGQAHELKALSHPIGDLLFRLLRVPREGKRDVLAHAHRVEERAFLKRHAELASQDVALARRHRPEVLAVDLDRARIGLQEANDVLQENALADPRLSDEGERLAFLDLEIQTYEDLLFAEALRHALEPDRGGRGGGAQNSTFVRKKSAMRIVSEPMTTAVVVDRPTPSAPPVVSYPHWQPTSDRRNPKTADLIRPDVRSSMARN